MKIVVIGGTGLIGSRLVEKLREDGHEPLAASPDTGVNALTGEGLAEALEGAQVVVDVANAPAWDDAAVLATIGGILVLGFMWEGARATNAFARTLEGLQDTVVVRPRSGDPGRRGVDP